MARRKTTTRKAVQVEKIAHRDKRKNIPTEELRDFVKEERDSLLVMNSLAEKEGLKGQVQTIYLDPPYGDEVLKVYEIK